ncbi:antibiotic biosynthesis monooxygenase family protein [Vibrio scophthalmi]|uniref:ABM domain-containing protein n=1 Tax=Vibrio scophthalmi TaxID=45658 RepID=A0A1E3WIE5_9VIBR|nr:antibiotic biosynthesis monooxygenase [Vibrio scophthalmi]ODS05571.1 uncharacterized protein VSF3289_04712 [Vibrio scophthalmi]
MFAVIFKAQVGVQNNQYAEMASIMRDLAFNKYNCQDFVAVTEAGQEVAISYWNSEDDILHWHTDSQHAIAQKLGQEKWYDSYTVEVVEIKRRYSYDTMSVVND